MVFSKFIDTSAFSIKSLLLRTFSYKPGGYSFWSGHASLSSAFTVFIVFLLRNRTKLIYLLFIFPVIFGYSRIYLGVHYPADVLCGALLGIIIAKIVFMMLNLLNEKLKNKMTL